MQARSRQLLSDQAPADCCVGTPGPAWTHRLCQLLSCLTIDETWGGNLAHKAGQGTFAVLSVRHRARGGMSEQWLAQVAALATSGKSGL